MNFDKTVIWIRFPKTGSTSLRAFFMDPARNWKDSDKIMQEQFFVEDLYELKHNLIYQLVSYRVGVTMPVYNKINFIYDKQTNKFKNKFPDEWKNSYKFTISRNPYDRFLSGYKHLSRFNQLGDVKFNEMDKFDYNTLNSVQQAHICTPIISNIKLDDLDYIIKYEHLEEDVKDLCDTLNINYIKLQHLMKTKTKPYTEYYKEYPHMQEFVYNLFKSDFEAFNYNIDLE